MSFEVYLELSANTSLVDSSSDQCVPVFAGRYRGVKAVAASSWSAVQEVNNS